MLTTAIVLSVRMQITIIINGPNVIAIKSGGWSKEEDEYSLQKISAVKVYRRLAVF